jgi:hypothetical protein
LVRSHSSRLAHIYGSIPLYRYFPFLKNFS